MPETQNCARIDGRDSPLPHNVWPLQAALVRGIFGDLALALVLFVGSPGIIAVNLKLPEKIGRTAGWQTQYQLVSIPMSGIATYRYGTN